MTAITNTAYSAMHDVRTQISRSSSTGNRVYLVGGLNRWQVEALQKLARFSDFQVNWDSYNSQPISDKVLDVVSEIISNISIDKLPTPRVSPIKGGGIQLAWEKGTREVELEIRPDIGFEVLLSEEDEPVLEAPMQSTSVPVIDDLLLFWLYSR
jgi:hypothetical protein